MQITYFVMAGKNIDFRPHVSCDRILVIFLLVHVWHMNTLFLYEEISIAVRDLFFKFIMTLGVKLILTNIIL